MLDSARTPQAADEIPLDLDHVGADHLVLNDWLSMPQPLPAELPEYSNTPDKNAEAEIRPAYSKILLLEA